jgi:hypothetical protein
MEDVTMPQDYIGDNIDHLKDEADELVGQQSASGWKLVIISAACFVGGLIAGAVFI